MVKEKKEKKQIPEEFLNALLEQAVRERASDVHIEPLARAMRVRFRVDGYLQERSSRPLYELEPVLTRIKAISNLDLISHLPQDGHFEFVVALPKQSQKQSLAKQNGEVQEGRTSSRLADALTQLFGEEHEEQPTAVEETEKARLNIRVSLFPTIYGNAAVLRLLNRADMVMPLEGLGMDEETLRAVRALIARQYGMVLVTGPSGSGKTTTLYSLLQELKNKERNIITLEDPVEFSFGDIRQTQIKPYQGFTFAVGMRSILRQDPDIIMVGEIRDAETAEHAIRASLVGRLVGSTVHANTALGTIARLLDMNVERSLIAYAINGVIAQRLVRKICSACVVPYTPDQSFLEYFSLEPSAREFLHGKGCDACNGAGYRGRVGVFEVLPFNDEIRSLIMEHASLSTLQKHVEKMDIKFLKEQVRDLVLRGVTTVEEAVRSV